MDFDADAINRNFKKFIGLTDEDDWNLEIDMSLLDNNINFSIYRHYINSEKLIGQLEMHKKWGTNLNICVLCSLYNSNPNLFYGDPKNIQKFIKKKNLSENIPIEIIRFFNNRYHSNILEYHSNHIFDYIEKSIKNNESPILLRDSFLHESKHAVNILNIDRNKIYYFENGKDSLINSIIKVYSELFIHNFKKLNSEFFNKYGINHIKKFLENNIIKLSFNNNTVNEYYSLIRNFVDYKKENNISEISIKYLSTSSKSLRVITFGDLNVKYDIDEYGEDSICKPINEEVEFNELTKRLNAINFSENPYLGYIVARLKDLKIDNEYLIVQRTVENKDIKAAKVNVKYIRRTKDDVIELCGPGDYKAFGFNDTKYPFSLCLHRYITVYDMTSMPKELRDSITDKLDFESLLDSELKL